MKESQEPSTFPAKLYHAFRAEDLPSITMKGLANLPSDKDIHNDTMGLPTCDSPYDARQYGSVVAEVCGNHLQDSGQYIATPNSSGNRITMRDSASMSGSGADEPMVDRLGTNIPFQALIGLVFEKAPSREKIEELGLESVKIYEYSTDEGELKELYSPTEEE